MKFWRFSGLFGNSLSVGVSHHSTPQGEEIVSSGVVCRVDGLREKIRDDYKETAFRKELWPDPPAWSVWDGHYTTQGGRDFLEGSSILYAW